LKKLWMITFLTLSLLLLALPVYAATEGESVSAKEAGAFYNAEETELTILYGKQTVKCENAAIKSGDVTYLPLREVLAAYGASTSWAVGEAEDKVIVTAGKNRYQMVVDLEKCEAYGLDNKVYALKHEGNILYLPVHFYTDLVNCGLVWNREKCLLTLNDADKKDGVTIFNPTNGGISYKKILNLPEYQKPAAPVVSRSGAVQSRAVLSGEVFEQGVASYYGARFHGRRTSSGEAYNKDAYTAAHKTLPFGTIVRVTAQWNGKSVDVKINDRGPFSHGRVIDISTATARELGMISKGIGHVTLEIVSYPQ